MARTSPPTVVRPAEVPTPRSRATRPAEADEPAAKPDLGTHRGFPIVAIEPVENLPDEPFKGIIRYVLHDPDGKRDFDTFKCADCEFFGIRPSVVAHRNSVHHGKAVKKRPASGRRSEPKISDDIAGLTLAQLYQFAKDRDELARVIEGLQSQVNEFRHRALVAEANERKLVLGLERLGFHRVEDET